MLVVLALACSATVIWMSLEQIEMNRNSDHFGNTCELVVDPTK